jgi:hypothetical protein
LQRESLERRERRQGGGRGGRSGRGAVTAATAMEAAIATPLGRSRGPHHWTMHSGNHSLDLWLSRGSKWLRLLVRTC